MGYRWRGYEHPELYKMINAGPGAAASDPQTTYWQDLAKELTEVDEDLNARLTQLGSRWEGTAGESAQAGLTPLASWASDAQTGATVMRISSEDQGQFVSDARSDMPEPVPVTTAAPSGWDIAKAAGAAAFGFTGPAQDVAQQANDHEAQEVAQNEAELRAVETMQTYESSSTWNRNTLGTFIAPPDVVVATPPPQGQASAVLIGSASVQSVSSADPGGGPTTHTSTGGTEGTVATPTVGNDQPPGTTGGGGSGGGGGTVTPPITNLTTTPSDLVITPPGLNQLPTPNPLPSPNPNPTPNPLLPGGNPFFGTADVSNNAGDIARRAMPLRPMPLESGPFGGRGGLAAGLVDGERVPSQIGRGGVLGAPGEGVVRTGPGAAGAAGRGGNGVHGPGVAGQRAEDEEDEEHYAADYLLEEDDVFGDDRRVSPSVLGE